MRRYPSSRDFLSEAMATIPSYMSLSSKEMNSLFDSFLNIFRTMGNSIQLLGSTLTLNFRVIQGALAGDANKVKKAFGDFNKSRREYDKKVRENLKYFYEFYNMSGVDGLGGYGPRWLLFAANPLVWLGAKAVTPATEDSSTFDKDDDGVPDFLEPEEKKKRYGIHPDLKRALEFFGYGVPKSSSVNEALNSNVNLQVSSLAVPPEAMKESDKIQAVAKSYVDNERKHAEEILKTLQGRVAFIKKFAESKNFEELQQVASSAPSVGIKWSGEGIDKSYKAIETELQKKQKEDPDGFKKIVEDVKKLVPELDVNDPTEAMKNLAFGMAKSEIQSSLTNSYNQIMNAANEAMGLPVDQQTAKKLEESEIGRQYLQVLRDFTTRLESGSREVGQLKNVFKGSKT